MTPTAAPGLEPAPYMFPPAPQCPKQRKNIQGVTKFWRISMDKQILVLFVAAAALMAAAEGGGFRPWPPRNDTLRNSPELYMSSLKNEGASPYVKMEYHMGPVLTGQTQIFVIWYGKWSAPEKAVLRDFLHSVTAANVTGPSVQQWWSTVQMYTDQTGNNISAITLAGERDDDYSQGKSLTRMTVQQVVKSSLTEHGGSLPVAPKGGLYLVLTARDVAMQDYCRAVCGFHYFTYPSIAGYTLPYAWVGNSGQMCPEVCAYPFAVPSYMGPSARALKAPNGDVGVDGMVSVLAHELAEMSSNPLINAWYAGGDPTAPVEIADLCEGMYGTGAGGGYTGMVSQDRGGATYNLFGVGGRRFLVQWVWSPLLNACTGPNRSDR
uniref:Phosphate-induced protein 1 n=1 Tax=Araucaria cunninghamii TaxID=56994 RepID=A0A0D6QW91_ARACU